MYEPTTLEARRAEQAHELARRQMAREQAQRVGACLDAWQARTVALDAARTLRRTLPPSGYALAQRLGTLPESERR